MICYEFGVTPDQISRLTPFQLNFLIEGLRRYYREKKKQIRRARRR